MKNDRKYTIAFAPRGDLAYDRLLSPPTPGEPFLMDESYRLCHLPLVNPTHSRVIAALPGKDYAMGRRGRLHSLVLPVAAEALAASVAYQRLESELRAAPFAGKIAWDVAARRRDRLHATLCGSLAKGDEPPAFAAETLAALAHLGPLHVRIEGLFSGNVNRGRLYLEVHPESRDGVNVLHLVQDAVGRPRTDLYLVGIHALTDDLDAAEAEALAALIARWRGKKIVELAIDELHLISSVDDLVLDGRIERRIQLSLKP